MQISRLIKNKNKNLIKFVLVQNIFDLLVLSSMVILFMHFVPNELFNTKPATGGDTGSHFWPVYTLHNYGIPNFNLRVWNPGNMGGEPQLVHYFPFPFIFMALLGYLVELGAAFNIGTILGSFSLPFTIYAAIRIIGFKFPAPIITSIFSLPFLYNEGYTMFGGNFLSTLAGQFAHSYALCFLILAISFIVRAIKKGSISVIGIILLSMSALSHAYVFLIAPCFFLAVLLFTKRSYFSRRMNILFVTGVATILITAWFIWPMIDHQAWMTPNPMIFGIKSFGQVFKSKILYPTYAVILISVIIFMFKRSKLVLNHSMIWIVPAIAYIGLFFVFPKLGLVDARALPQTLLFTLIAGGLIASHCVRLIKHKVVHLMIVPVMAAGMIIWIIPHVKNFPHWTKWNYSGWEAKKHYSYIKSISDSLEPGFDKPRILYEHHPDLNQAGTTRVFEMLPYFAKRSTMEGLYMQSTLMAPVFVYLQAKVSVRPSCALRGFKCPKQGFDMLKNKLNLIAISSVILLTEEPKKGASMDTNFVHDSSHGPYSVYSLLEESKYAVPITGSTSLIEYKKGFKDKMQDWFSNYDGQNNWMVVNIPWVDSAGFADAIEKNLVSDCDTSVDVSFTGFELYTACPGVPHLLKFAYQDSWKNSSNKPIYLMAPGMMGFIPDQENTKFEFGQKLTWKIANYISLLSFVLLCLVRVKGLRF